MSHPYQDIIGLSRPLSKKHPPMSRIDRAAQFAPFAALTGYGDAVEEEARLTCQQESLSEEDSAILDAQVAYLAEHPKEELPLTLTYFVPDERKQGGKYSTLSGKLYRVDLTEGFLILTDKTKIPLNRIVKCSFEF